MKTRGKLWALVLICGVLLSAISGSAAAAAATDRYLVAGIENAAEFEKAFFALQAALKADDRGKVADAVLYPLRVNGWMGDAEPKATVQFSSRPEVLENYDEIFTSQIKETIIQQKIEKLFVNWQGVMVGNGEAWLAASAKQPVRYGIIAVNLGIDLR